MSGLAEIFSAICILAGSFFCITGALGLLRLPDFFNRAHGAGVLDGLGAGLILLGFAFQAGSEHELIRLVLILTFMWITGPTAVHALARAALHGSFKPVLAEPEIEEESSSKPQ